jgi:hypothetical protein
MYYLFYRFVFRRKKYADVYKDQNPRPMEDLNAWREKMRKIPEDTVRPFLRS